MFGTLSMTKWGVSYVNKDGTNYYVSEIDQPLNKIVWTTRKEKAKHFGSQNEASNCLDYMKRTRKLNGSLVHL
jgi:hypothetical protein